MASSEPRLSSGDGTGEVYDVPTVSEPTVSGPIVLPPTGTTADPLDPSAELPIQSAVQAIAPGSHEAKGEYVRQRAGDGHDTLPPLISVGDMILEAPAWLFSAALHMIAVIILGLLFIVPEHSIELLLRLDDQDGFEELSGSEFDLDLDVPEESADASLEVQELPAFEDPMLVDPTEVQPLVLETESLEIATPIRMALSGRSEGMQQKLLEAYGGTGATQRAVMNALRWLQRNQTSRGLWSLAGAYKDGARIENREAATGLALLAFQGAGYTPNDDPQHEFTKVTSKAWRALLQKQNETGDFFQDGRSGTSQLYSQAICTIALCELYGMTQDSRYREPAQRAIDYCVRVQSSEGGWRYYPGSDSDLSVTGWFAMAMQSARMAGLEVPSPTLMRISGYLDSVGSRRGVFYSYRPVNEATASMTAEGLLCRQYLGWSQSDDRLRSGANYLIKNLPTWKKGDRDVYYWYYATQVCHHMEGKYWRTWNDAMKVVLPKHQEQAGRERGSWDPKDDEWGNEGGRLFVTCLSTFMLEVYYRHLPIYKADILSSGL